MKQQLSIALLTVCILMACKRQDDFEMHPPLAPEPIVTDSIIGNNSIRLTGEKWIIEQYRIGEFTNPIAMSDTLEFISHSELLYQHFQTTYSFYPSASIYVLTLNESPWGMISGALNSYQLNSGEILATPFSVITPGSATPQVFLWMKRV